MSISDTLQKIKQIIVKKGWVQKKFFSEKNDLHKGVCPLWAADLCTQNQTEYLAIIAQLTKALIAIDPSYLTTASPIVVYNDTPGRTVDEIYALIDKAISNNL